MAMAILLLIVSATTFILDYKRDMGKKDSQLFIISDDLNWFQAVEAGKIFSGVADFLNKTPIIVRESEVG